MDGESRRGTEKKGRIVDMGGKYEKMEAILKKFYTDHNEGAAIFR